MKHPEGALTGHSVQSKARRTLIRMAKNDQTVYRDLKSYAKEKSARFIKRSKFKVGNRTRNISNSIALVGVKRLNYSIDLLMDVKFYEQQSGQAFETKKDALSHYNEIGQKLELSTHPLFNTKYYIAQNPVLNDVNPLEHFFYSGGHEGLSV